MLSCDRCEHLCCTTLEEMQLKGRKFFKSTFILLLCVIHKHSRWRIDLQKKSPSLSWKLKVVFSLSRALADCGGWLRGLHLLLGCIIHTPQTQNQTIKYIDHRGERSNRRPSPLQSNHSTATCCFHCCSPFIIQKASIRHTYLKSQPAS